MTQTSTESRERGGLQNGLEGLRNFAARNPATQRLLDSAEDYVSARAHNLVGALGDRVSDTTSKLSDVASGDAEPGSLIGRTAKGVAEGESPVKAAASGVVSGVKDKVKDAFGGKGKGGRGGKSMNIVEDIEVGVPVRDAYNRWTQFTEFSQWAKGVQQVNQDEPTKTGWSAKIFWSKRRWTSTITEQIPDQRIAWESEGEKGSVNGVVTFHPLGDNLTKVLLVLEYFPAGLFEKTGNLWRAQGRRARLDLKLFRRFVMLSDEEVEGWRGEIRDGEVVSESDEESDEEQRDDEQRDDYDDEQRDADDDAPRDADDEERDDYEEPRDAGDGEQRDDFDEDYDEPRDSDDDLDRPDDESGEDEGVEGKRRTRARR